VCGLSGWLGRSPVIPQSPPGPKYDLPAVPSPPSPSYPSYPSSLASDDVTFVCVVEATPLRLDTSQIQPAKNSFLHVRKAPYFGKINFIVLCCSNVGFIAFLAWFKERERYLAGI
jgi:hypothetical protein